MSITNSLLIAAGLSLLSLLINDIRVFLKVGWNINAYKKYWKFSEGNSGIVISHVKLFIVMMAIPIILIFSNKAFSASGGWFDGGYFVAGIQASSEPSVFCQQRGVGGNSNSNFTAAQRIYTWSGDIDVSIGVYGTHHSCDISPDAPGYDKAGPMFLIQW